MDDYSCRILIPMTLRFFDHVLEKAKFKRKSDVDIMFKWIRVQIPLCAMMLDGQRMMTYAQENALKATTEQEFRDLIKKVWAAAKEVDAATRHRLLVFFIGTGSLCGRLAMSAEAPEKAPVWIEAVENGIAHFLSHATSPAPPPQASAAGSTSHS